MGAPAPVANPYLGNPYDQSQSPYGGGGVPPHIDPIYTNTPAVPGNQPQQQQFSNYDPNQQQPQSYPGYANFNQQPSAQPNPGAPMQQIPAQFAMLQQPIVQDMAMQYGQKLADQGKQIVESHLEKYISIQRLKYYFAVDNNYVIHKLRLLFFPFTHSVGLL